MQEKLNEFFIAPFVIDIQESEISKYYFTSDLHLNHRNIFYFTNRRKELDLVETEKDKLISEFENKIIDRFNTILPEDAILVNCGDIMFGKLSEFFQTLDRIKCQRQYIIMGNHDYGNILKKPNQRLSYDPNAKYQFSNLIVFRIFSGGSTHPKYMFSVSHMPLEDYYGQFNIHGHLHSFKDPEENKSKDFKNYETIKKYKGFGTHFDCGLERNGMNPVPLIEILNNKTDIIL